MDSSLTHLPPQKQADLQQVVTIIRASCPAVQMVILFGSYARGDWKEAKDLAPDRRSGHASDYDILAVTEDDEECDALAWHGIDRACSEAGLSAPPRIIHHDIDYLNGKLERGQYFFTDIVNEGKVLYDTGVFTVAQPRALSASERLDIARKDFAHWFKRAEQFYGHYRLDVSNQWLETGAFNLHQTSEACFKTVLLVFTGYIPDEHYLMLLSERAAEIDRAFGEVFSRADDFQCEAFKLLDYAYIGARYDKRYTIDAPTLSYLAERVSMLLELTKIQCEAKILALEQAANT